MYGDYRNLRRILIVLSFAAITLESTPIESQIKEREMAPESSMNIMVDVSPASPNAGTSLASSLCPLMAILGRPDWTMARMQGVMGHAFQFDMYEGGSHVNHDHLDWGPALEILPQIAEFREFGGKSHHDSGASLELKQEARDAVRESLRRGTPALAWSPMGPEIKAVPGPKPYCWGLIIGYNDHDETYTVRHPWVDDTYTVRYDALGTTGEKWFNIKVFDRAKEPDQVALHLVALQHAVGLATETRYAERDSSNANRRSIPHGFSAYEVWREAFESEDVPHSVSRHHAKILRARRSAAAEYMRELVAVFPNAEEPLEATALAYDRELESLNGLYDLCVVAHSNRTWTTETRAQARIFISEALAAEREAIANIQASLIVFDESR
ncbi:MAG: hypothetical protein GKR89_35475 [Candidatus Latescibacteria bacterium]|nr:hypothetical protein [Candidatus Latescibacterota bacterium]